MQIEELANDFITAYNSGNEERTVLKAKIFFGEINKNESQLRIITHHYTVARALYYLLQLENNQFSLTIEDATSILRLVYYCLLKNYMINSEVEPSKIKYADIIGGSELLCTTICRYGKLLMYNILSGSLHFMPNYSHKHLSNQLTLFGGIVKEANENNHYHSLDENITRQFNDFSKEAYQGLPINEDLRNLKAACNSVIQTIIRELELGLKMEDDYLNW